MKYEMLNYRSVPAVPASPLVIPAGNLSGAITITIVNDTLDEPDETVIVTMGMPVNATPGAVTVHTATITDNDPAPSVQFTSASQSGSEGAGTLTVTAQLTSAILRHQRAPSAKKRSLEAKHRRQQDIELARFDFLECSDVEVCQFGEAFLCQAACIPLASEICSKADKVCLFSFCGWHAVLRRNSPLDVNGAIGRNLSGVEVLRKRRTPKTITQFATPPLL